MAPKDVLLLCRGDGGGAFTCLFPGPHFLILCHPWMLSSDLALDSCLEMVTAKRLLYTNVMMELAVPF